jgi:hypothetical protein
LRRIASCVWVRSMIPSDSKVQVRPQ